jgi:hypothetical protein
VVAALLLLLYLIWGAIDWITSGGESGKVQKARDKMTQAVIGLIVLAASLAIYFVVQSYLGLSVINLGGSGSRPDVSNSVRPTVTSPGRFPANPNSGSSGTGTAPARVNAGECVPLASINNFTCSTGQTYTDPSCRINAFSGQAPANGVSDIRCKALAQANGTCFDPNTSVCFGTVTFDSAVPCQVCNATNAPTDSPIME